MCLSVPLVPLRRASSPPKCPGAVSAVCCVSASSVIGTAPSQYHAGWLNSTAESCQPESQTQLNFGLLFDLFFQLWLGSKNAKMSFVKPQRTNIYQEVGNMEQWLVEDDGIERECSDQRFSLSLALTNPTSSPLKDEHLHHTHLHLCSARCPAHCAAPQEIPDLVSTKALPLPSSGIDSLPFHIPLRHQGYSLTLGDVFSFVS